MHRLIQPKGRFIYLSLYSQNKSSVYGGFGMTKKQVFDFIKEQKTAMISSVDEDGFPNTKAMLAPRKIDGNSMEELLWKRFIRP